MDISGVQNVQTTVFQNNTNFDIIPVSYRSQVLAI